MSSSPDGHSAGSNTPTSDVAPTSNTTATSGFTAVNGRRSPTGSDAHINGLVKMDTSADAASRYDTVRVAGTSLSASPADEPGHLALNSPGKRKRSDGERRDPTTGMEQGTGTYASSTSTGASVSASASAGAGAAAPPDTRRTPPQVWSDSPAQGMQRAPNHQPAYGPADNDPKDSQGWYSATAHRQQRAESPNADARLAEALQRDNSQSVDARHLHHDEAQVMDHIGGTPQHQITSTTETTAAGVQVDPKKRKRIFSNRTKTGCQTCRKRKKKCDEGKPECSNCTRGGFVCEGYANKSTWQKPIHGKSQPIALQSKDSYGDTGGLMPRPPREGGYQLGAQTQLHSDGQRARPILVDEDHPRSSWGNSWNDNQTPSREYISQRTSSVGGFSTGTPLPDPTRPQASYESRMSAQDHHLSLTAHGQLLQQHVENLPNEMGKRNDELSTLPQMRTHGAPSAMASTAQLALQHSQHMATSSPNPPGGLSTLRNGRPMSEKDKMTAQMAYTPNTDQLIAEREACSGATWRFNNSQNPSTGVSREERSRLFRQILEPQTGDPRRSANPLHTGHLGQGVVVEAPFNCSYGYNTKIGDSTSIGRNCTIHDPVLVSIGARCRIGPNVDIYAGEAVDEAGFEAGVHGSELGKQVEIEDNVIIEGRCVIKAGVRIKTGSRILAGTVVDKNVPAHVVFGSMHNSEVITGKWQHSR